MFPFNLPGPDFLAFNFIYSCGGCLAQSFAISAHPSDVAGHSKPLTWHLTRSRTLAGGEESRVNVAWRT